MARLWEISNQNKMSGNGENSAEARQSQHDLKQQVKATERRVEYMAVVIESLWELVGERAGITEDDLAAKIIEVDARDGQLDGRRRLPMVDCACGARIGQHASSCAFCGQIRTSANVFDRR